MLLPVLVPLTLTPLAAVPNEPLPDTTFRAAALAPPIVLLFESVIATPLLLFGTAPVPAAFVPILLPCTRIDEEPAFTKMPDALFDAVPLPEMTFAAPAAVPPTMAPAVALKLTPFP